MTVTTKITHRYLMNKSKSDMAHFALMQADMIDDLQRESATARAGALEWAAAWIEGSLVGETDERLLEFARNMAMSIRASK